MLLSIFIYSSAKLVVFTDDVHSKREQQIAEQYKGGQHYQHFKKRSIKMKKLELETYNSYDLIIGITEADCKEIVIMDVGLVGKVLFVTFTESPWDHGSGLHSSSRKINSWKDRKNLIFVGNGENPTNVHAINWYLEEVAAEMDKGIPGVKTFIVGPGWEKFREQCKLKSEMEKYLSFEGSLSNDELLDLIDKCKVFISPIIASTGINTKNVLALSHSIPLVTTPAGSVGMCKECDTVVIKNPMDPFGLTVDTSTKDMPLLVGRDVYDFVSKVKDFYYFPEKWEDYSKHGLMHVNVWFGKKREVDQIDKMFQALFSGSQ